MSDLTTEIPPPTLWAQRNDVVFLTINVECKNPEINFTENSLKFSGVGLPEKKNYSVLIEFFEKIKNNEVITKNTARCIEMIIPKAELSSWPALTADKKKHHWLKVDFNKWADDSDASDEEMSGKGGLDNIDDLIRKVDHLGGAGDSRPSFDDLDEDKDLDSDDDEMPGLA